MPMKVKPQFEEWKRKCETTNDLRKKDWKDEENEKKGAVSLFKSRAKKRVLSARPKEREVWGKKRGKIREIPFQRLRKEECCKVPTSHPLELSQICSELQSPINCVVQEDIATIIYQEEPITVDDTSQRQTSILFLSRNSNPSN